MNLAEYQAEALRTAGDTRLETLALGLCGEAAELWLGRYSLDASVDEAGDVLWYAVVLLSKIGAPLPDLAVVPVGIDPAVVMADAGVVADQIKKHVGHGHALDVDRVSRGLQQLILDVRSGLWSSDFGQVLQHNVDKLRRRYPDGFSTERSVNRAE